VAGNTIGLAMESALIGTVLDKYEIVEKVGEGGMATVYRGRHQTLNREVAIKVLHPHLSASTRNRRRFAREARAIEHLTHDNILTIFDYSGVDANDCYIVTEFVEGKTLHELVDERGLLPSEIAAVLALDLAHALAYAHRSGIIHRDLKPDNVMLRADGAVKLMDFGIARFLDESTVTMTGALVGSPAYMSPEQALEKTVDARSDLFSLGTLLFHLVTGQLPFTGSNPSLVLRNIIESNRPDVLELQPGIAPQMADLIECLLQIDVEARLDTAEQVAEHVAEVLADADLDPTRPEWELRGFLEDPDGYELRLRIHLDRVLLERGREAFEQGDHLKAQRLLNRLLAFDPEHAQVLELLNDLHRAKPPTSGNRRALWIGGALAMALALFTLWLLRPEPAVVVAEVVEAPDLEPETLVVVPTAPVDATAAVAAAPQPDLQPVATALNLDTRPPRPVDPAPVVVPEPVAAAPGTVVVRLASRAWGDILIDGERVGRTSTRNEVEVAPGAHTLTVRSPLSEDWTEDFEIAAGERKSFNVSLTRKPATVVLDGFDNACVVMRDGTALGTVGTIGGQFRLAEPHVAHQVDVTCPGGTLDSFSLESKQPGSRIQLTATTP